MTELFPRRPETADAVDRLRGDVHELVQANAWMSAWRLKKDLTAVEALVRFLGNRDWMVAEGASRHLVSIGAPAVGHVRRAAGDETFPGRVEALGVAGRIDGVGARTIAVLRAAAYNEDRRVSTAAVLALAGIGKPSVTSLIGLLGSSEERLRKQAIEALGTVGPEAKAAVPALCDFLDDVRVQGPSIRALSRIGSTDEKRLRRMTAFLDNANADVRAAAVAALGSLGGAPGVAATEARTALRALAVGDSKGFVRQAAREALQRLERDGC